MKLTLNDIKNITFGTAYINEEDDKILLHRFTKEQEAMYETVSENFYRKTFATSGVKFDFYTDSRTLGLSTEIKNGSSRKFFKHSIHVNGKKFTSLGGEIDGCGNFGGFWTLPEGEKRITVYLPWSASSAIREMVLDDGAFIKPVKKSCTMISFGDSITHGYDSSSHENSYAGILANELDANSINKGIGGEFFRPELSALRDDIEPDYITVAYGTNDWSARDEETYRANCNDFYANLSKNYPNAKIFAVTPVWRHDWLGERPSGAFYMAHRFIADAVKDLPNVTLITGIDLIPHDLSCYAPDGLHPNDKGFKAYGHALAEIIKKYI